MTISFESSPNKPLLGSSFTWSWLQRLLPPLLGTIFGLALWIAISTLSTSRGFPKPLGVGHEFVDAVTHRELYDALMATLRRIFIAWTVAYSIGVVWGLLAARSRTIDGIFRPWLLVGIALPSPVAVLFSVLLFGLSETSALLALVIITAPFVANIVFENAAAVPRGLVQMGSAYRFGTKAELQQIIVPYLVPALLSAARLGLQLSWKMVVVMEAIARPDGIGERLSFFYQVLQPDRMVAYTLIFSLLLGLFETGVFRPISRHVLRWRSQARVV